MAGWVFSGLRQPRDVINSKSVVGIKPGNSGEVVGYQVDEFTCTSSTECFVAQSQINFRLLGNLSSLIHLLLELGHEDYTFFDYAVDKF